MESTTRRVTDVLRNDLALEFERLFKSHFGPLQAYAFTFTRDTTEAEEIVQQVFLKVWERKEKIDMREPLTPYLYRAVYNESLNYLKHLKVKDRHRMQVQPVAMHATLTTEQIDARELEQKLMRSINELPEQCRTVFQLSRFEQLKYNEIADKLGISVKTVENHMSKAIKKLKASLDAFLLIVLLFFINY